MNQVSVRLVFDRKHVATKTHQALVQLEITHQSKRKFVSTGIKLYIDQWGKNSKVKNHPQALLFNQQLSEQVACIYDFVHECQGRSVDFTFKRLDDFLNRNSRTTPSSFLDFMEARVAERPIQEDTRKHHRAILNALKDFGGIKFFDDLNYLNIKHWDEYAKRRCNCQSSVYNYHKVLKIYIHEALNEQIISIDPYQGIKLDRGQTSQRRFLTKEELDLVELMAIDDLCLSRVRDLFVFCCYTGLAYADLTKFDFNKAVLSDGMYRIKDCRKKTGAVYNISLMNKPIAILRKYSFSLPIISNQKYNSYLKVLSALCGVKKRLTSHVARHTFATTIAMAHKVPIEVISKMLGHTNIRTTQLYAKVYQSAVDEEFNRLNELL